MAVLKQVFAQIIFTYITCMKMWPVFVHEDEASILNAFFIITLPVKGYCKFPGVDYVKQSYVSILCHF